MIAAPKSRAGWLSALLLTVGGLLIVSCIAKTFQSASDRYWPLLAIGFPLVCAAAPFYYYFKHRDATRTPYANAGIQALAAAGKLAAEQKTTPQTSSSSTQIRKPNNPPR